MRVCAHIVSEEDSLIIADNKLNKKTDRKYMIIQIC